MTRSNQLDAVFSASANLTGRAILAHLAKGQATLNALAEPFDMSLPAISRHIRVLEKAGLVTRGREAQFRPCTLNTEPLQIVADWTDQYCHIRDARFAVTAGFVHAMKDTSDE